MASASTAVSEAMVLDRARYQAGGSAGIIYILRYLDNLEQCLHRSEPLNLTLYQDTFQTSMQQITSPPPAQSADWLGRPIRRALGRVYVAWFAHSNGRGVYDAICQWMSIVDVGKAHPAVQILSMYLVGVVFTAYGSYSISLSADIVAACLRSARNTHLSINMRFTAADALAKVAHIAVPTCSRTTHKDIIRHLRSLLLDRSTTVALACVLTTPSSLAERSELDNTLNVCVKAMETNDISTRHQVVDLAAAILLKNTAAVAQTAGLADPGTSSLNNNDDSVELSSSHPPTTLEIFQRISQIYQKPTGSRRLRNCLWSLMSAIITHMDHATFTAQSRDILRAMLMEVAGPTYSLFGDFETKSMRTAALIVLKENFVGRLTGESERLSFFADICATYLHKSEEQSSTTLILALDTLAMLLDASGMVLSDILVASSDVLFEMLEHTESTVRTHAALVLCKLVKAAPTTYTHASNRLLDQLSQATALLAVSSNDPRTPDRIHGWTAAFSGLLCMSASLSLYASKDGPTRAVSLAMRILRESGDLNINAATAAICCAWKILASVMHKGPDFIGVHLPQLMLLWKNALPKPLAKDSEIAEKRTMAEWLFLLRIREASLRCIHMFLVNNSLLLSFDVERRITAALSNCLSFSTAYAANSPFGTTLLLSQDPNDDLMAITTRDAFCQFRYRLLQSFTRVCDRPSAEPLRASVLALCSALFCQPTRAVLGRRHSSVTSPSASSLWDPPDDWASGLSSSVVDQNFGRHDRVTLSVYDTIDVRLERILRMPILKSLESDDDNMYNIDAKLEDTYSPPMLTALIDCAMDVFSRTLPYVSSETCTELILQIVNNYRHLTLKYHASQRKQAVVFNVITTLSRAFTNFAALGASILVPEVFQKQEAFFSIVMDALVDKDSHLRDLAAEALGCWCNADPSFLAVCVQALVARVVADTDPYARAGCVQACAAIYARAGVLSAAPVLRIIADVTISLAADPHPLVHRWALQSLASLLHTAGLGGDSITTAVLGMVTQVYCNDSYNPESESSTALFHRKDLDVISAICMVHDGLIVTLDPLENTGNATLAILTCLMRHFLAEADTRAVVQGNILLQHMLLLFPNALPLPDLVQVIHDQLNHSSLAVKQAAMGSVYQMVNRQVNTMSTLGGDKFVNKLFLILDTCPDMDGVVFVIESWLNQTARANPIGWIEICKRVTDRNSVSNLPRGTNKADARQWADDESSSLGRTSLETSNVPSLRQTRWQTRAFALRCLCTILRLARMGISPFHIASGNESHVSSAHLIAQLANLVRIASTAIGSEVEALRLNGIALLSEITDTFCALRDGDAEGSPILRQYQAAIVAAVLPLMTGTASVDLKVRAISFSGALIASRIWLDLADVSRLVRLLRNFAECLTDTTLLAHTAGLGDCVTEHATTTIRYAILSAWAEICVAAHTHNNGDLCALVSSNRDLLIPLWSSTLHQSADLLVDSKDTNITLDAEATDVWYSASHTSAMSLMYSDCSILNALALSLLPDQSVQASRRSNSVDVEMDVFVGLSAHILWAAVREVATAASERSFVLRALRAHQKSTSLMYEISNVIEPSMFDDSMLLYHRMFGLDDITVDEGLASMLNTYADAFLRLTVKKVDVVREVMHCEHLAYAILRRSIRTGSEVSLDMAWTALLRLSSCAPVSLARHVHAALLKEILDGVEGLDQSPALLRALTKSCAFMRAQSSEMREFQKPVYTRALLAYSQALQSVFKTVAGDGATPNNDDALHHVQQPSRGTVKVSELQSTVGLLLSVVAEAQMSPVAESVLRAASCALLDTFSAGNSHLSGALRTILQMLLRTSRPESAQSWIYGNILAAVVSFAGVESSVGTQGAAGLNIFVDLVAEAGSIRIPVIEGALVPLQLSIYIWLLQWTDATDALRTKSQHGLNALVKTHSASVKETVAQMEPNHQRLLNRQLEAALAGAGKYEAEGRLHSMPSISLKGFAAAKSA